MPELNLTDVMQELAAQKDFIEQQFKGNADLGVRFDAEVKAFDERIKMLERMLHPNSVSVPGVESEAQKFSWSRAFYAILENDWSKAGFEKEVFEASRKAALEAGTGTSGGFLVPVEVTVGLIEMIEANEILSQLGVSKITGITAGVLEWIKQTGGATAYWVGENQDITESELTFGMMTMSPKSVAALVKTSARLLALSNPSIDAIIQRDIALRLALKISLAGLRGQGTQTQPKGIANQSGINTVYAGGTSDHTVAGAAGGNIDFDVLQAMEYALEEDNALFGKLGFAWHPCVRRNLMKLKIKNYSDQASDQPYIVAPMTAAKLQEWITYPFFASTQIPTNLTYGTSASACTEVYFGNWQEFIMAMWGGVQIAKSTETSDAFQKNQTWIRIIQDVDMGIRHSESFCLCPDVLKVSA